MLEYNLPVQDRQWYHPYKTVDGKRYLVTYLNHGIITPGKGHKSTVLLPLGKGLVLRMP